MAAVKVSPLPGGGIGPLGGPFVIENADADPDSPAAATVLAYGRWIARAMTYYDNKGGIEDSSLFKSFTAECFEEISRDDPEAAACLTDLTVVCNGLPDAVGGDPQWRLHRAILSTLPGVRFVE